MLGQPSSHVPVITLRQGHRYAMTFGAPIPCAAIPPQAVTAAIQALGATAGVPAGWTNVSFSTTPAAIGCRVEPEATWSARDVVIDPEVARLPGLALLPVEQVRDVTTGQIIYDVRLQERPAPPGPAPGNLPSSSSPPARTAPTTSAEPGVSPGTKFLIGAVAVSAAVWFLSRRK